MNLNEESILPITNRHILILLLDLKFNTQVHYPLHIWSALLKFKIHVIGILRKAKVSTVQRKSEIECPVDSASLECPSNHGLPLFYEKSFLNIARLSFVSSHVQSSCFFEGNFRNSSRPSKLRLCASQHSNDIIELLKLKS